MENVFDHKTASIVDTLRLIGELEHMRFHALVAAVNAPDDEIITLLVIAKHCQDQRREIMQETFGNVAERHWCMVKCAGRLLQIVEELAGGNTDRVKQIKNIIDDTIELATGVDISGCESCRADKK